MIFSYDTLDTDTTKALDPVEEYAKADLSNLTEDAKGVIKAAAAEE